MQINKTFLKHLTDHFFIKTLKGLNLDGFSVRDLCLHSKAVS